MAPAVPHGQLDQYPDAVQLILSGYTSLKTVTEAVNEGAIYKFATKPWDDEDLRAGAAGISSCPPSWGRIAGSLKRRAAPVGDSVTLSAIRL